MPIFSRSDVALEYGQVIYGQFIICKTNRTHNLISQ